VNGGRLGKQVKYTPFLLIYIYLCFRNSPTGQTPGWIFARDGANDAVSRKGVPFGVKKFEINILPLKNPLKVETWAQNPAQFSTKTPLYKIFVSKQPLIVIGVHKSCIMSRQYGNT